MAKFLTSPRTKGNLPSGVKSTTMPSKEGCNPRKLATQGFLLSFRRSAQTGKAYTLEAEIKLEGSSRSGKIGSPPHPGGTSWPLWRGQGSATGTAGSGSGIFNGRPTRNMRKLPTRYQRHTMATLMDRAQCREGRGLRSLPGITLGILVLLLADHCRPADSINPFLLGLLGR